MPGVGPAGGLLLVDLSMGSDRRGCAWVCHRAVPLDRKRYAAIKMTVQSETGKLIALAVNYVGLTCIAAGAFSGPQQIQRALLAGLIAAVPAVATYVFAIWTFDRGPVWQLGATLGGTTLRSLVTLFAGLILYVTVPVCQSYVFWLWVLVDYLVMLALEVTFLLRANSRFHRGGLTGPKQHQI